MRFSLNPQNPMNHVVVKEKRALVMLRVNLQAVSRPGVLFSDCNAARNDAVTSDDPTVIRFDVVKAASQYGVRVALRRFYQAEVLVPSPIPPHLIEFPDDVPGPPTAPLALHSAPMPVPLPLPIPATPAPPAPSPQSEKTDLWWVNVNATYRRNNTVCAPEAICPLPLTHELCLFGGEVLCKCGSTDCPLLSSAATPALPPPAPDVSSCSTVRVDAPKPSPRPVLTSALPRAPATSENKGPANSQDGIVVKCQMPLCELALVLWRVRNQWCFYELPPWPYAAV